jgi:hypothetical protein
MQVPALFQPMNLGAGFENDVYDPYADIAYVDNSGNVNDQNGNQIISADAITRAAMTPGADVGQAVAQELEKVAPDWTKQFKDADSLVKAAYSLFNTSKAVVQGKPIPQTITSPYVYNPNNPGAYNPNVYRPTTTATTTQLNSNTTNMLLVGGVALVAFLALRKK